MSTTATDESQRAMADVDKVAEAICGTTSAGKLFPWPTLTESEREAWRRMAVAAIDALRLTEETNAHYGDRYTDDEPATRRRLVSPWQDINA
jgi:hypothetical protein